MVSVSHEFLDKKSFKKVKGLVHKTCDCLWQMFMKTFNNKRLQSSHIDKTVCIRWWHEWQLNLFFYREAFDDTLIPCMSCEVLTSWHRLAYFWFLLCVTHSLHVELQFSISNDEFFALLLQIRVIYCNIDILSYLFQHFIYWFDL